MRCGGLRGIVMLVTFGHMEVCSTSMPIEASTKLDACSRGHIYVEGSYSLQLHRKTGRTYRRCKQCNRESHRRNPATEESLARRRLRDGAHRSTVTELRERHQMNQNDARLLKRIIADEAEGDMAHKNDERPSAPWNYLRPKGDAQEKLDALNKAIDAMDERTRCFNNPEDYSDYDEERPPTVVEAAMLCAGCPVLDLCRDYAVASKDRGVWGGIRVTDNKKLIGLEVK